MGELATAVDQHGDGAVLRLHVVPRASRTGVAGFHAGAVKLKVHAPPVEGAANTEVCRFVAELAGVPRSAVSLLAGARSRQKTVLVRGVSAQALRDALARP